MRKHYEGYRWNNAKLAKLVKIWNSSHCTNEAVSRMGLMHSEVCAQISRMRQNNVPLRRFRPREIDFNVLRKLGRKTLK